MPLDERQLRRETFDPESVAIEFPGHGTWFLPRPRLTFRRGKGTDGKTTAVPKRTWGVEYDQLIDRLETATNDAEFIAGLFDVAADLLGRNYNLSESDLDELLTFEATLGTSDWPPPWGDVYRTAVGLGPKSNAVGSSPG